MKKAKVSWLLLTLAATLSFGLFSQAAMALGIYSTTIQGTDDHISSTAFVLATSDEKSLHLSAMTTDGADLAGLQGRFYINVFGDPFQNADLSFNGNYEVLLPRGGEVWFDNIAKATFENPSGTFVGGRHTTLDRDGNGRFEFSYRVNGSQGGSASLNMYFGLGQPDIHISPVPEPETYGMMLLGLGLMGFIARRRKSKQV